MYTNVYQRGAFLYVRGVENGQRFQRKVEFRPTLWTPGNPSDTTDKWLTLDGKAVYPFQPGSINDCRQYIATYGEVHGLDIYESPGHIYQYIANTYPGEMQWNVDDVTLSMMDEHIDDLIQYGFMDPIDRWPYGEQPFTKFVAKYAQRHFIKDSKTE